MSLGAARATRRRRAVASQDPAMGPPFRVDWAPQPTQASSGIAHGWAGGAGGLSTLLLACGAKMGRGGSTAASLRRKNGTGRSGGFQRRAGAAGGLEPAALDGTRQSGTASLRRNQGRRGLVVPACGAIRDAVVGVGPAGGALCAHMEQGDSRACGARKGRGGPVLPACGAIRDAAV